MLTVSDSHQLVNNFVRRTAVQTENFCENVLRMGYDEHDLHVKVGKAVRAAREAAGLSARALAEKVGLSDHSHIVRIEHADVKNLNLTRLSMIARALDVPLVQLVTGQSTDAEMTRAFDLAMEALQALDRRQPLKMSDDLMMAYAQAIAERQVAPDGETVPFSELVLRRTEKMLTEK